MQTNDLACLVQARSPKHYSMEANTNYHIRIKGHLAKRWTRWFEGLEVTQHPNVETLISGVVMDQAALHGTLNRIRDLGLK
jgi:hypothetical protein